MNRPNVRLVPPAPAHHLRPAQTLDDRRNPLLQNRIRSAPCDFLADANVIAAFDDVVARGVVLLEKSFECLIASLARRTLDLLFAIAFPQRQLREKENDPAGRAADVNLSAREQLAQLLTESRLRRIVHPSRNFFGQELEEVLRHLCGALLRRQERESELAATFEVLLRAAHREIAHAFDHRDALGGRHRAARVERVENVRALQRPVVRRKDQLVLETSSRFGRVLFDQLPVQIDVRDFEVVLREFVFVLFANVAVSEAAAPFDVEGRALPRQKHREALDAVGDLRRDGRKIDSACLLEIRELRDLHAVEQNLPADTPGAERRRFPVVFFKSDVVTREIESDRAQRVEIDVLYLDRRRFEDDLKLVMLAETKRVVAVTTVGRTARWLNVRDFPWLGTEAAQERGGGHRARA